MVEKGSRSQDQRELDIDSPLYARGLPYFRFEIGVLQQALVTLN